MTRCSSYRCENLRKPRACVRLTLFGSEAYTKRLKKLETEIQLLKTNRASSSVAYGSPALALHIAPNSSSRPLPQSPSPAAQLALLASSSPHVDAQSAIAVLDADEATALRHPSTTSALPRPRVASDDFEIMGPPQPASPSDDLMAAAGPSRSVPEPAHQPEKIYPWTKEVKQKLKGIFKMAGFRRNQKEIIDATLSGKDGESAEDSASCETS